MNSRPNIPRGLGKGLGAILSETPGYNPQRQPVGYINKQIVTDKPLTEPLADIMRIPIGLIDANPFQPRLDFNSEALEELAESIKSLGLIQPITVRRTNTGRFQIISGERRFRASKIAGLEMLPAYIRETSDQDMLVMAIVENIQREDLDPIETALAYQRLIDECSLTQEQMAVRIGKKRTSVTNYLRLLKLPAKVQHDLKVGMVSVGHAKVLLGIDDPLLQEQLCDAVIREEMSVRELEERIKKLSKAPESTEKPVSDLPDNYYKVLEFFGRFFGDNISLRRSSSGKGSFTIRFSSDEEIQQLIEALEKR